MPRHKVTEEVNATVVELPLDEWELLERLADADDRSVSQMATRLLRRALREIRKEEKDAKTQETGE